MGLYTEVIRERDRKDRETASTAEARMMHRRISTGTTGDTDGAQLAVHYILDKFDITANPVWGYTTVNEMLDQLLDPLGIIYEEMDLTDPDWNRRTDYMLAFREDGVAVVLIPTMLGYKYVSPETGETGKVNDALKLRQTAYAVQRPIELRSGSLLEMGQYVIHLVSWKDAGAIGAATLLVSALGLVAPKMNQQVLQTIVPMGKDGYSLLMRGLLLFLMVGIIRGGISAIKTLCLSRTQVRIGSETQAAIMSRVLLLPQTFFTGESSGKLSRQINNSRLLAEQIISFIVGAAMTAVFSVMYIPQMASFSVKLLVPALIVLALKCGYTMLATKFFAENEKDRQQADLENRAFLFSMFKGIQRIKESGAEKRVYARWTRRYQSILTCDLNQPAVLKLEFVVTGFLTSLTTVILLAMLIPNGIDKSDYIAFNASFALIVSAVDGLTDAHRKVFQMKPLMAQLAHLLEEAREDRKGQTVMRKLDGDIRLENVSFSYDGSGFGCLKDISLHIRKGEKIAIVGESGCGKSTLLKIILGVLKPESGGVLVDNKPLDTILLRSYRRHIGSVFQFSRVMPGTVYSNIAFSSKPVSREEAKEAAIKADIDETIMRLPLAYDTEISDSNTGGFSGGQRQRLLLARAFASKPGLMILDEATSALDNISQNKVLDAVYKESCTVIMVAHRLSTVRNCDRIVVLKDGCLSEQGTFDELMAMNGVFHELMNRQSA